MSETKRTPEKWIALGNNNALIIEPREGNRRIIIATGLLKEHADNICRATNCHEGLVETARKYANLLQSLAINRGDENDYRKLIAEAEECGKDGRRNYDAVRYDGRNSSGKKYKSRLAERRKGG